MATPLFIGQTPQRSTQQPALIFETKELHSGKFLKDELTYGQLAHELTRDSPPHRAADGKILALEALPCREHIITLLWRLTRGLPTLLLHPSLSSTDQAKLEKRVTESSLHPETLVVLATSGTSGEAKLVQLGSVQLQAAAAASLNLHPFLHNDRWLFALPYAHVGGLNILVRCLLNGACAVIPAEKHPHCLKRLNITIASLVPTQLFNWLESDVDFKKTALRYQLVGGAPVHHTLLTRAQLRGLNPLRTYGLTETCAQIATEAYFLAGMKPLNTVKLAIKEGEIAVSGPQLMLGYLGETPLKNGAFFLTGDSGEFNKILEVHGRKDARFISGGENISPEWVESKVGALEGVKEWALTWKEDARWGQAAVVLYVPVDGDTPALSELESSFKDVPAFARPKQFICIPQLPLTSTGKWARSQFAQLAVPAD